MSLTPAQQQATKDELQHAMDWVGLTPGQVAKALQVSEAQLKDVLALRTNLHNPWIVKEYLAEVARQQGKQPITFTALRGDYHDYWFLNPAIIDARKIQ